MFKVVSNMRRQYMKPTMRVVEIRHQHFICTSPDGYDNQSLGTYRGSGEEVTEEKDIF